LVRRGWNRMQNELMGCRVQGNPFGHASTSTLDCPKRQLDFQPSIHNCVTDKGLDRLKRSRDWRQGHTTVSRTRWRIVNLNSIPGMLFPGVLESFTQPESLKGRGWPIWDLSPAICLFPISFKKQWRWPHGWFGHNFGKHSLHLDQSRRLISIADMFGEVKALMMNQPVTSIVGILLWTLFRRCLCLPLRRWQSTWASASRKTAVMVGKVHCFHLHFTQCCQSFSDIRDCWNQDVEDQCERSNRSARGTVTSGFGIHAYFERKSSVAPLTCKRLLHCL
jgi:hypothetical protein